MIEKNLFGQAPIFKRAFSAVFALFLVLGALVFMGCPMDGDDSSSTIPFESNFAFSPLIGTWEFTGDYGTEAYRITADTIKYGSGSDTTFTSTFEAKIHGVQYFTDEKNSGMLYIEYTSKKPQYYSYADDYSTTGGPFDPPGNFIVVMFHDLNTTNNTVKLANPYSASDSHSGTGTDGSTVTYSASEVATLAAARDKFNIDTESNFLYNGWAGVSAQTKVTP
jgi:hypothetical protein